MMMMMVMIMMMMIELYNLYFDFIHHVFTSHYYCSSLCTNCLSLSFLFSLSPDEGIPQQPKTQDMTGKLKTFQICIRCCEHTHQTGEIRKTYVNVLCQMFWASPFSLSLESRVELLSNVLGLMSRSFQFLKFSPKHIPNLQIYIQIINPESIK